MTKKNKEEMSNKYPLILNLKKSKFVNSFILEGVMNEKYPVK